jgi:hypothetical protein
MPRIAFDFEPEPEPEAKLDPDMLRQMMSQMTTRGDTSREDGQYGYFTPGSFSERAATTGVPASDEIDDRRFQRPGSLPGARDIPAPPADRGVMDRRYIQCNGHPPSQLAVEAGFNDVDRAAMLARSKTAAQEFESASRPSLIEVFKNLIRYGQGLPSQLDLHKKTLDDMASNPPPPPRGY